MASVTISITIPEQLEECIQKQADTVGISRSRFIGNILLDWQKNDDMATNDCACNTSGLCIEYDIKCMAPQVEAETCAHYEKRA